MDETIFDKIFSAAAGVWTLVLMAAVALFKAWPHILQRINERQRDSAAEKAEDWRRLRDERDRLQRLLTQCETERIAWMARAVTAEAQILGIGMGRQQVAEVEAARRIIKDDKPGGGK